MKLAIKGVSLEHATVGEDVPWGAVVAHVFVPDSSEPICRPFTAGSPPALITSTHGAHWCRTCWDRMKLATVSITTFSKQHLWAASIPRDRILNATAAYRANGDSDALEAILRPDAWGLSTTEAEAFASGCLAVERLLPADAAVEIHRTGEADALKIAREQRAEARAKKISASSTAQLTEYVYQHEKRYTSWLSSDFEWETKRFKVLRKTPKRLFVENVRETYKTASGATVLKTYALDRSALQKGKHRYGWTLDPNPPFDPKTGKVGVPGWADVLGVTPPCTISQVKSAFRRAVKIAHPDHGGSDAAFQRVQQAFQAAQRAVAS